VGRAGSGVRLGSRANGTRYAALRIPRASVLHKHPESTGMPMPEMKSPRSHPNGFTRPTGIAAFLGALLALSTALWGLWGHWIVLGLFLLSTGVFSVLYSTRLCRHCDKNCPFHSSGQFWRQPR